MNILIITPVFYRVFHKEAITLSDVESSWIKLSKRGHNICVLASKISDLPSYETVEGIKIFRVPPLTYVSSVQLHVSFPFITAKKLIEDFNIDVVHANIYASPHAVVAAALSKIFNLPFVLAIEGPCKTMGKKYIDVLFKTYMKTLGRFVVQTADRVIVIEDTLVEDALRIGASRKKISLIRSGIDVDRFDPEKIGASTIKNQMKLNDAFVIGYAGRFVPLKGLTDLIFAVAAVREMYKNVKLLLVGDGPLRPNLERLASDLEVPLVITGWIADPQVFYDAMDVFVLPSYSEGLPIVALEAMAMEKPVVLTSVGGSVNLVNDGVNGFLMSPGDCEMLTRRIIELIENESLRKKMGQLNRRIVTEKYSLQKMVEQWDTLFSNCLNIS